MVDVQSLPCGTGLQFNFAASICLCAPLNLDANTKNRILLILKTGRNYLFFSRERDFQDIKKKTMCFCWIILYQVFKNKINFPTHIYWAKKPSIWDTSTIPDPKRPKLEMWASLTPDLHKKTCGGLQPRPPSNSRCRYIDKGPTIKELRSGIALFCIVYKGQITQKLPQHGKLNNFIHPLFLHWPKNAENKIVYISNFLPGNGAQVPRHWKLANAMLTATLLFFLSLFLPKKNGKQNFNWTFGSFLFLGTLTPTLFSKKWCM